MATDILHDVDAEIAALFCNTTNRPLDCPLFRPTDDFDAREVASAFLLWLSRDPEAPYPDARRYHRVDLELAVERFHEDVSEDFDTMETLVNGGG